MANRFDAGWRAGWRAAMDSMKDDMKDDNPPGGELDRLVSSYPDELLTNMDAATRAVFLQVSRASRNAVKLSTHQVAGRHAEVPLRLEDYIGSIEQLKWALSNGAQWKAGIAESIMAHASAEKAEATLMWVLRQALPFDWGKTMFGACLRGLLGVVDRLIEYAKKETTTEWRVDRRIDDCLTACLIKGHLVVANRLVEYALLRDSMDEDQIHDGLENALLNGREVAPGVVLFLLEREVVSENQKGIYMTLACSKGIVPLVDWLCADGICTSRHNDCWLSEALNNQHEDIARTLLANGMDVDYFLPHRDVWRTWQNGNNPLNLDEDAMEAVFGQNVAGKNALVRVIHGLYPNIEGYLPGGYEHALTAVRFLLENNAKVNMVNSIQTPLQAAAERGHSEVVELLLEAGANVDMTNTPLGRTALMVAVVRGNTRVVVQLLDAGANVTLRDVHGDSAWALAVRFLDTYDSMSTIMEILVRAARAHDIMS